MRLRLPRLLRLMILLLLLLSLITAGISYGVQAAQPTPLCLLYREGVLPQIVDPRSGRIYSAKRNYETVHNYPSLIKALSPDGQAFAVRIGSDEGTADRFQPDKLLFGIPSSEKLRLVAGASLISGGWSPDGSVFAYIMKNQNGAREDSDIATIVIADPSGHRIRVQPLNALQLGWNANLYFAGWSADGKYIAALERTIEDLAIYYFIAVDTLQIDPTPTYSNIAVGVGDTLVWSPQGHRFAYINFHQGTTNRPELIIATPEGGIEQHFVLGADNEDFLLPIVWSPDGRHVAIRTAIWASASRLPNPAWYYWTFRLLGVDGSIHIGTTGHRILYHYYRYQDVPDGWWSADGSIWFFRLPTSDTDSIIMAYYVALRTYQTITRHVAGSPVLLNGGDWLAVPVWSKEKLDIAFLSMDGVQRQIIDRGFDEIMDIRWLDDQRSLSFVGRRGDAFTFEIVDLYTGESMIKIDGLPKQSFAPIQGIWPPFQQLTPSPSGQKLVLRVGELEHQSLILISLATKRLQPLLMEGYNIGNLYWAADESAFAFIQRDSVKQVDTLQIVSADGDTLNQIELLPRGSNILAGWTWCP